MKIIGVIPARYNSTRLPGKPLILIKGRCLIERVWLQVKKCRLLDDVIIATDDKRILEAAKSFGANAVMTSKSCKSGTDRLAQAAKKIGKASDVFINIQGDEPLISPLLIDRLAAEISSDSRLNMITAAYPIKGSSVLKDPNTVKVVMDNKGYALYFSRYPVPYNRKSGGAAAGFKHIGIYAYRKDFLLRFSSLKQTSLEKSENLEQLRVLENGHKIKVIIAREDSFGVDTPEDVRKVGKLIR